MNTIKTNQLSSLFSRSMLLAYFSIFFISLVSCEAEKEGFTDPGTTTSNVDLKGDKVFYLGSESEAKFAIDGVNITNVNPEDISTLLDSNESFILIADGSMGTDDELFKSIAAAENPIIIVDNIKRFENMLKFDTEKNETDITKDSEKITFYGYTTLAGEQITYTTFSNNISDAMQDAYTWGKDILGSKNVSKAGAPYWSRYTNYTYTTDVANTYRPTALNSNTLAGRYNVRHFWSKLRNDGDSNWDYFTFEGYSQTLPSTVIEPNSKYPYGNSELHITIQTAGNQGTQDYKPTSTGGSTTTSFSLSLGADASGPNAGFTRDFVYTQPDISVSDQSDVSNGRIKWVYGINFESNAGTSTLKVNPSGVIRVPQGTLFSGSGLRVTFRVAFRYEARPFWLNDNQVMWKQFYFQH